MTDMDIQRDISDKLGLPDLLEEFFLLNDAVPVIEHIDQKTEFHGFERYSLPIPENDCF